MAKKYIPNEKEKYMCSKHKTYFKKRLMEWKNEVMESNNKGLYFKEVDHEMSALLSKIDKAIKKIQDNTYGYCDETGEPIGIKRLIARPIATLSIEAQQKHEKNEKIFANI